jgi:hypothetical protein
LASAAALCAAAAFVQSVKADNIINTFDSAAEATQWHFAYGGANHTEGFSTDDAGGNPTSGSLDLGLTFDGTGGANQSFAYSKDAFFPATDLSGYLSLDFDVKVTPGSAPDAFGNNGYFQMWINNTDAYTYIEQFGDNVKTADGWRHISVPLTAPVDQARAFTFQLFGGNAQNIVGTVGLRLDNVVLRSTTPPGTSRAGHHFSFESATDIDPSHPSPPGSALVWGDSYGSATVTIDHSQSSLHATDGAKSLRLSQPLATNGTSTQVLYNGGGKFNSITTATKLLMDVTTPGHGPGYQTLDAHLNFGGAGGNYHYISAYNGNFYQFVDTNPGGANTRTEASTQTFTWDFGGQMVTTLGALWPDLQNYNILHLQTGNGGAAVDDPSPDATSEYFLDNVRVVNEDTSTRSTWQTVAAGDWTDASKWTNGVPNGVAAPAIFYGIGAGTGDSSVDATVNVNAAVTVGSIVFDSQMTSFDFAGASALFTSANDLPQIVNYGLTGTGSLTFSSGTGATAVSEIYAIAGSHSIGVPVQVNSNMEIDTSAGFGSDANPSLPGGGRFSHVAMTSLAFTAPVTLGNNVTLTTHGPGTVSFSTITGATGGLVLFGGNANLNGDVNVASLAVASAAKATVTANGSTVVRTNSLVLDGTINLADNSMIVDYTGESPLASIQAAILSGYAAGAWNGAGLDSSVAASTPGTAIGFAEAGTVLSPTGGTFRNQSVDGTAVLIRYTYAGDVNVDGTVDTVDFNVLASHFGESGKSWQDGDANYDGAVDTVDFNLLASNFSKSLPAAPGPGSLVPEPAAGCILALAALAACTRRRRAARSVQ